MQMPIKTVGVILFRDDQVLLVCHGEKASHKNGVYGLPAGRIEEGENSKQAAVRELREESDLITEERFLLKVELKQRLFTFIKWEGVSYCYPMIPVL